MQEAPAAVVLVTVAVGLAVVALVDWRPGLYLVGLAVLLGAGLRASLPERSAGMLAVRARGLDVALLLVLGSGVLVLAHAVPRP